MKITISGSLGNIGKHLTKKLIAAGHNVTVISSNSERKADIEALGAQAAIGSVSDAAFLKKAFAGADAVFAMTPPNMGGSNVVANTTNAGKALAEAIKESGVKRVVMLSSVGADKDGGTGPVTGVHNIEQIYNNLDNVSLTFLRAGYFFINYFNDVPLIKGAGIIGANYPANTTIPLVHPEDIATAVVEELQKETPGKNVSYIVSDVRTTGDIAKVLGTAIGKPELPWVEFSDDQSLQGMTQAGIPEEIAKLYTEMGTALRKGIMQEDFIKNGSPVNGKIKLEDFAKEFAAKF